MDKTKIDWCDSTWNPVTGCLHGCEYCYAKGIADRYGAGWETASGKFPVLEDVMYGQRIGKDGKPKTRKEAYPYNFTPTFHRYHLNDYTGKKSRNIFVCSMADLFGSWVPDNWIEEVFKACEKAPQHNYLFLTKNPERYVELAEKGILRCSDNMWYGWSEVSDDKRRNTFCFPYHINTFVSVEPILEPVHPSLKDWIIVGAETGRRKNKVIPKREWIEPIVEDCKKYGIPLFMKSSLTEIWKEPLIQEFPGKLK